MALGPVSAMRAGVVSIRRSIVAHLALAMSAAFATARTRLNPTTAIATHAAYLLRQVGELFVIQLGEYLFDHRVAPVALMSFDHCW